MYRCLQTTDKKWNPAFSNYKNLFTHFVSSVAHFNDRKSAYVATQTHRKGKFLWELDGWLSPIAIRWSSDQYRSLLPINEIVELGELSDKTDRIGGGEGGGGAT